MLKAEILRNVVPDKRQTTIHVLTPLKKLSHRDTAYQKSPLFGITILAQPRDRRPSNARLDLSLKIDQK